MHIFPPQNIHEPLSQIEDEYLFGWDPTPGIISVWANREGLAIIWRREGEHVITQGNTFAPGFLPLRYVMVRRAPDGNITDMLPTPY